MDDEYNSDKKPFVNYGVTEDPDKPISLKITMDERVWLVDAKRLIRQTKTSTALKQLARIGYEQVLLDTKIKVILDTVLGNVKRNDRTGVTESEYEL